MPSLPFLASCAAVVVLARAVFLVRRLLVNTKSLTVPPIFFVLPIPWRLFVPRMPYLNPLDRTDWTTRFTRYAELGATIMKTCTLTTGKSTLWVAEPRAVKVVSIDRRSWAKPTEMYEILAMFGKNLVTTEGAEWKAHRRVVGPSFTEAVYSRVFNTTTSVVGELLESEGWDAVPSGQVVHVPDMVELTMRLALVIISREAFDIPMPYDERAHPMARAPGQKLSTSEAMAVVSSDTFIRLLTPTWMYRLPIKRLHTIDLAFTELDAHMLALVHARRVALARGEPLKDDLFSSLLLSGEDDDDDGLAGAATGDKGKGLTDRDVIGNTFIFLLAGHETSGHTLAFVFALLALHPHEQQKLYDHIMTVLPDGHEPTYADFARLTHSLAVLYETTRLFPSVTVIPKRATADTTLPYSVRNAAGEWESTRMQVPAGTEVYIDTAGLHANPEYWDDPLDFKPKRFLTSYEKDAFVPFSAGPRACVGRRFAEVSTVVILSLLVRTFELSAEPRSGESRAAMEKRLLKAQAKLTLTPKDMDLRLRKR